MSPRSSRRAVYQCLCTHYVNVYVLCVCMGRHICVCVYVCKGRCVCVCAPHLGVVAGHKDASDLCVYVFMCACVCVGVCVCV